MDEHVVFLYVKDRGGVDNWWQGKVKILIIHPLVVFERNVWCSWRQVFDVVGEGLGFRVEGWGVRGFRV
jgi:hypothetical protein